jgi:hypothetical protein
MRNLFRILALAAALVFLGCNDRVDETDSGGVLLEMEFEDSVYRVSVNDPEQLLSIPTVNIESIPVRQDGATSSMMDVQLQTIEVIYTRADTGTRTPPPFYINLIGTVPVGGVLTYTNLPIMSLDQLDRVPLSELRFENGAFDRETGASVVKLNATIRAYGRTVAGKNVSSTPRTQTFEFVP